MSTLLYKTIANERPQGKPNVYFSCHPEDCEKYFADFAGRILKIQDCAVWYESEPEAAYDAEDLELRLSEMQLFVMPVTTRLLTTPNRAMDVEFPLAMRKHIPVLPLMMEQKLTDVYRKRFGDLQYLDPYDTDETSRSFDEVLTAYIRAVLVSNELAARIRAAFDAYIFLSYRKKDRRLAQELMRLIHKNPLCRDIAIWYDEFLTPGEDFNQAIGEMLERSDLFALAVTPNLVNEVNYVMTTEYPAAQEHKKPVLPVEMAETDRAELEAHYEGLPPCVRGEDGAEFREALLKKLRELAITVNDEDPEHNYLIGLAYLDGIDVEVDAERALELITGAAEAGVMEAMSQLFTQYETGKGVARDYRKGIEWREKHVAKQKEAYEIEGTEEKALEYIFGLLGLGDAQYALRLLDGAEETFEEMRRMAELSAGSGNSSFLRTLSESYNKLGDVARLRGDLAGAQAYYEKGLAIAGSLAEETGTVEARRDLSVSYNELGGIAAARGDLVDAQAYYERVIEIREVLAMETDSEPFLWDLAAAYFNTAIFYYKDTHDREKAKELFQRVMETGRDHETSRLEELRTKARYILENYF